MKHNIQRLLTECPICLTRTEWKYIGKQEIEIKNQLNRTYYWRKCVECGTETSDESLMAYRESLEERFYE